MKKAKPDDTGETPGDVEKFPVIGVGASAGGLDALKKLLGVIPERSGMAFVLVQHSDPAHQSMLSEILQKATKIPVREITNDIRLEPDMIYVAPSSKLVTSVDGALKLTERKTKSKNLPIDIFFSSLAVVHTNYAAGVVLSGTGSDGTEGLRAIKDHGGICIAQDPVSAAYDGMPQSAIHTGVADFVLPPEKIPAQLLEVTGVVKANHGLVASQTLPKEHEDDYGRILSLLHQRSGVDFMYYKQNTVKRRIARRMKIGKKKNLADYSKQLLVDEAELDVLFQDLLIPVTSFFRDPKTFEALRSTVFPLLLKDRSGQEPLRMWIAGCSTGEEAFSLAICLHEFLEEGSVPFERDNGTVQIFASDISAVAIKKARTGCYAKDAVKSVSKVRLKNYFTKNNGGYQLKKNIRDMCIFAPHNFLKDPPFARMDLVSCRNVLIYMESFLQKKALTTFHYALKRDGFLLLGKSESTSPASELFASLDKHEKIYSPKSVPGRSMHVATERSEETLAPKEKKSYIQQADRTDFRKCAEDILLSRFTPAGVIVNEHMDIVHIHGTIAPFLEPSPGTPTFNILKMARVGLAFELRNALNKAGSDVVSVIKENVPIQVGGERIMVTIEIVPLPKAVEPHHLVLFTKLSPPVASGEKGNGAAPGSEMDKAQEQIEQLEKELLQARDDMQSVTEDMEALNEELQSANEELQSSNEEMQSLNEELETSKEELQSTNEELITVNDELLENQDQLNTSLEYSKTILETLRGPFLVLDKNLRIQRANDAFYKEFDIRESEIEGRSIFEIQDGQWDRDELRTLLEKVLPKKERLVDFESAIESRSLGRRTLLLNVREIINKKTAEKMILFAIEDVTDRRNAEAKMSNYRKELETEVKKRTAELEDLNAQHRSTIAELERSNERLDQFAHVATHDLQEPLRKILTFSGRLREDENLRLPERSKTFLDKIQGSSKRMAALINDLLDYSRVLDDAQLYARTDLETVLQEVLSDFELLILEKGAEIANKGLPTIEAIPLQMTQLFHNLISNSVKFAKEGIPPKITISSKKMTKKVLKEQHPDLDPGVSYVEILIMDNGIGFDQKYEQQMFTIFKRLNRPDEYVGTGVGLALVKKIVENHNGLVFARSKVGEGALFTILLPIAHPSS